MADITTSIKIEADASKAVNEMQRLQSATDKLKQSGKDVVIAPKVEAPTMPNGTMKVDVDASTIVSSSKAAASAVEQISAQYQNAAISAANAQVASSTANTAITSTSTTAASVVSDLGNSFQAVAIKMQAAAAAQNTYNTYITVGEDEAKATAAAVEKYNEVIAKNVRVIAGGTTVTKDWAAEAERAAASIKATSAAIEENGTKLGWLRSNINKAAEAYKNFSSGSAGGMDKLRNISLNILSDYELIKRTALTMFEIGTKINEFFTTTDNTLGLISHRTVDVEKGFIRMGLSAKSPTEAIDELNKKIDETAKKMLDIQDTWVTGATPEATEYQIKKREEAVGVLAKESTALNLLKQDYEAMLKAANRRAADRTGLGALDEETKIRKEAELDIADLQDKIKLSQNKDEKDNLNIQIENRKKVMNKALTDYSDQQQKKKDDEKKQQEAKDKEAADKKQKLLDDSRQAEINSMEGINKIDQQYLFDLDKINRQLRETTDEDEKKALIEMGKARLSQQKRETDEYWADYAKKQEEAAQKQKDKARDAAEYQKSLMEEMIGYQKQIVAGFSGLGQSVFPKEAMNYLRQIAGASNKFP